MYAGDEIHISTIPPISLHSTKHFSSPLHIPTEPHITHYLLALTPPPL